MVVTAGLAPTIFWVRTSCDSITLRDNWSLQLVLTQYLSIYEIDALLLSYTGIKLFIRI